MCLDFENIIYINCEKHKDRRVSFENDLKTLGISATRYEAITNSFENHCSDYTAYCENNDPYHNDYNKKLNYPEVGCLISHLEVIRNYGQNNDLLVFEDDTDLLSVNYWNFSFKDFIKNLPKKTNIVQLVCYPLFNPLNLKKLEPGPGNWGTASYFIKKEYSKYLVEKAYSGKWRIENLNSYCPRKTADSVLYSIDGSYSCTIFSLKDFESSINSINTGMNKSIGELINYYLSIEKPDINYLFCEIT